MNQPNPNRTPFKTPVQPSFQTARDVPLQSLGDFLPANLLARPAPQKPQASPAPAAAKHKSA